MVPEFTVESDGVEEAFAAKATGIFEALIAKVDQADNLLADRVRGKLSGEVLQLKSGKLMGTVETIPASVDGDEITGGVEAGGPEAPYGVVQEYGGRTAYEILPVNAKALSFQGGTFNPEAFAFSKASALSEMVIVKRVIHPPLAERSFARSAVDEMRADIVAMLESAGGRDVEIGVL